MEPQLSRPYALAASLTSATAAERRLWTFLGMDVDAQVNRSAAEL